MLYITYVIPLVFYFVYSIQNFVKLSKKSFQSYTTGNSFTLLTYSKLIMNFEYMTEPNDSNFKISIKMADRIWERSF